MLYTRCALSHPRDHAPQLQPHYCSSVTIMLACLSANGNSLIVKKTGHSEAFKEENTGTPSVLQVKVIKPAQIYAYPVPSVFCSMASMRPTR